MVTIKPFAALRPKPGFAARICELPYDVLSSAEARKAAAGNPHSFFHVSKPEIDLPEDINPYDAKVYALGRDNFQRLIAQGLLVPDRQPCFYLYRQIMGHHRQTGLVAAASCEDYLQNIVKKHELTRPDKEEDRVRHIDALGAQTGPVFLTYPAQPEFSQWLAAQAAAAPAVDFTAQDGVRHTGWVIDDPNSGRAIEAFFRGIDSLYIADGHHRSAAAARVFQERRGRGHSGGFLSVIFPHDQLQILPYHRILKDLNGLNQADLLQKLARVFVIETPGTAQPKQPHELGFFLDNRWLTLAFQPAITASGSRLDNLDVGLLQRHVLEPIFAIANPRTSRRIQFVGGIRGPAELERLVQSGQYACAFSMHPTGIDDLIAIADTGNIMPPKSTWFEPKLRDGMFSHLLD